MRYARQKCAHFEGWLSRCSRGVAQADEPDNFACVHYSANALGDRNNPLACVEVNTALSRRSIDPHLLTVCVEINILQLRDCEAARYLPKQHIIQVAHHMTITHSNFTMCVCATDVVVLFSLLLFCPTETLRIMLDRLDSIAAKYMSWDYLPAPAVHSFS